MGGCLAGLPPYVFRSHGSRRVFRKDGFTEAAAIIGPIHDGDEICGFVNGQFSLVDILEHVLTQTGPADITLAAWTMGIFDAEKAYSFVRNKLIRRVRFIVDPSMFSRRPEFATILVRGFGPNAFRAVNNHAKFCTVRSDRLAVCVRSSMNMNSNKRLETFDLSASGELTAFFEGVVDDIWRLISEQNKSQAESIFDELLNAKPIANPKRANPFRARKEDSR